MPASTETQITIQPHKAISEPTDVSKCTPAASPEFLTKTPGAGMAGQLAAFCEFARPHTIIGTTLASTVMFVLASAPVGVWDFRMLLTTWLAGLCVNIYVVGINQITDVEIDRINKPYLPLASGAFSMQTGYTICAVTGALSIIIAASVGRWLLGTIAIIFLIGTAYSVPPLRLKRFPFWAMASITVARAVVFHLGLYLSYSEALTGRAVLPPTVAAFAAFQFAFVVVIAIMKDVPDIEGDRKHNISTFVANMGAKYIMTLCRGILTVAYTSMATAAALGALEDVSQSLIMGTHISALIALWMRARGCNDEDPKESYKYYMFIWKLFYFEFASFIAAFLLASKPVVMA